MPRNDLVAKAFGRPPTLRQNAKGEWEISDQSWGAFIRQWSNIDILTGIGKVIPDSGKGYGLGFNQNNSNKPAFFVGDKDEETYFQFDGDDVSLGRNSQLLGADYYGNDTPFLHDIFPSLDAYKTTTTGSGAVGFISNNGAVKLTVTTASGDFAELARILAYPIENPSGGIFQTWNLITRFKTRLQIESLGANDDRTIRAYIGSFEPTASLKFGSIGFRIQNDFALEGSSYYDDSESVVDLSTTIAANTSYLLEAVIQSGNTSVKYYVDGTEKGTISTNVPITTASTNSEMFTIAVSNTAASASSADIRCSEWMLN